MFRKCLFSVFAVLLFFSPVSSFAATLIGAGSVIEGRWSDMSPASKGSYGEYIRFAVPAGSLTPNDVEIYINGVRQNVDLDYINGRYSYRNNELVSGKDYVRIVLKKPVLDVYFGFHGLSREYTYDSLVKQSRFFFQDPLKAAEHAKIVPEVMLEVLMDGGLLSVVLTGFAVLLAVGLIPRLRSWFLRF